MNSRDMGYMFGIIILVILLGIGISFAFRSTPGTQETPNDDQDTLEDDVVMEEVALFYPNSELAGDSVDQCSAEILASSTVEIEKSDTVIEDTIETLVTRELTDEEISQGFQSEFPNENFELASSSLSNGELTLTFTEVPGFTSGGSCRVSVLKAQITETALQFDEVETVTILPETLFQP